MKVPLAETSFVLAASSTFLPMASSPQVADRRRGRVLYRIFCAGSSRRHPVNHQQPFHSQHSEQDHRPYSLGALLSRRIVSQGAVHPRCIPSICQELDSAPLGRSSIGSSENRRGGASASCRRNRGWKQSQNQMRDVRAFLSCRALGILYSQPDFFRNPGRGRGQTGAKRRRSRQRQTPGVSSGPLTGTSSSWSQPLGVSGSASRFSRWSAWRAPRRTRRIFAGWTAISRARLSVSVIRTTGDAEDI